ncbi:hypothetical protein ACFO3J_17905 [Streptomyces polygonati]|uniref:Uncharacterized protein n=1 Tax=Streptomyces polygonati TaxID=1617087 RepID=A0ABV8HN20_9ACTN
MHSDVIAAPLWSAGRDVVDQLLDAPLEVVWQAGLSGYHTREARLMDAGGAAWLVSSDRGVLTLGAGAPSLRTDADWWPVPVRFVGSAHPGGLMLVDDDAGVYRLTPGQAPVPVWESAYAPDALGVTGLPGGRLLVDAFDDWSSSTMEMIDEVTGHIMWRSGVVGPVMPVGDQLVGAAGEGGRDLVSLDLESGEERWRNPRALTMGGGFIAVVNGVLWIEDTLEERVRGFGVDSGRPVESIALPRPTRLTGVLDPGGRLHSADEHGWLVVDLARGRVDSDTRFENVGIDRVLAARTVRSADGRLVLADTRGQIFVVHPAHPHRPEPVTTCAQVAGIAITAGRVVVLSYDGTLTGIGARS